MTLQFRSRPAIAGFNSVLTAKRAGEKIQVDRKWSEWVEKIERGIPVVAPPNWTIEIGPEQPHHR